MEYLVTVKEKVIRTLTAPIDENSGVSTNFIHKAALSTSECESISDGVLCAGKGDVILSYNLDDDVNVDISFNRDEPKLITVTRTSPRGNALTLVFEEGVRHVCVCKNAIGAIEMVTRANRIDNRLMQRGRFDIDYFVEIQGVRAEKTQLKLTVLKNEQLR